MDALIQITTGAQGAPVVSARDLYSFLGFDSSQWSRWSKKNITNNPYATQGEDWLLFDIMSKTPESGRPSTDYALTLDFAKRLSMLARTDKGEEARRYFLDCEKRLLQSAPAPVPALSTEQVLLQLVQQSNSLLAAQQQQLNQLRADVEQIQQTGHRPGPVAPRPGKQLALPGTGLPPASRSRSGRVSLRQLINHKVNDYCAYHGAEPGETYNYLYKRMYDVYSVNVYRLHRAPGESLLDALERYGHLERLYSLIMAELSYVEE